MPFQIFPCSPKISIFIKFEFRVSSTITNVPVTNVTLQIQVQKCDPFVVHLNVITRAKPDLVIISFRSIAPLTLIVPLTLKFTEITVVPVVRTTANLPCVIGTLGRKTPPSSSTILSTSIFTEENTVTSSEVTIQPVDRPPEYHNTNIITTAEIKVLTIREVHIPTNTQTTVESLGFQKRCHLHQT